VVTALGSVVMAVQVCEEGVSKGAAVDKMERRRGQVAAYWGLGRNTGREMIERDEVVALHIEQSLDQNRSGSKRQTR
jgi:hypothetical protein